MTSLGDFTWNVCLLVFWLAVFVDRLLAEVVCFDTVTLCSISFSLLDEGSSGAFYFLILRSDLFGGPVPAAPVAFSPDLVARGVLEVWDDAMVVRLVVCCSVDIVNTPSTTPLIKFVEALVLSFFRIVFMSLFEFLI